VNVLQQLRAAVAQEGASATLSVPAPAPLPAAAPAAPLRPCPFTFGDWLPRTDPQAQPGEAQRAVLLHGAVVAWWRREWVPPLPISGYNPPLTLEPYHRNAIYLPDGSEVESSCFPQTALERLAERLGA
jgi:hypothetical protein